MWLFSVVFDLGCLVKVSSIKAVVFDLESIFTTTGTEWGMIFHCCLVIVMLHLFGGKHFPENVCIFWCLVWHKILINRQCFQPSIFAHTPLHSLVPPPLPLLAQLSLQPLSPPHQVVATACCFCHHCNHHHLCHYCAYMISMIFCEWKITKSAWDHFKVADKHKKTNGP